MEVDDEEVAGEEDEGPEAREEAVSGLLYQISMLAMDDGVQGGLITSRRGAACLLACGQHFLQHGGISRDFGEDSERLNGREKIIPQKTPFTSHENVLTDGNQSRHIGDVWHLLSWQNGTGAIRPVPNGSGNQGENDRYLTQSDHGG
ncbi:hypothetical protein B0H14DRAFT_3161840 [Mycena olivaceomarginata]|nr:hypothetical protein B0H14DRAFT_3161840 [Mycena olivaceomarginata]